MKLGNELIKYNDGKRKFYSWDLTFFNDANLAAILIKEAPLSDLQRSRFLSLFVAEQSVEQVYKDAGINKNGLMASVDSGLGRLMKYLSKVNKLGVPIDLNDDIIKLGLSTRAERCLRRGGIETVNDLVCTSLSTVRSFRNMGNKSIEEVVAALERNGIVCDLIDEWEGENHEHSDFGGHWFR